MMSLFAWILVLAEARFALDAAAELSGAAHWQGELVMVSDDATVLYKVKDQAGAQAGAARFALEPWVDLAKLPGFPGGKTDFEGLAACPDALYVADERERRILAVTPDLKTVRVVALDLTGLDELPKGGANAGFEGVAADCAKGVLYVAKERDPRRLYSFDLKTGKRLAAGDVPPSGRPGPGPDFADLAFDGGHLYALERNTHEIVRIDPATFAPLARVSYDAAAVGLYDTGEPYGVAEVLVLTGESILVGFDNNGKPLSKEAATRHGVSGAYGGLFRFKRPQGF